MKLATLYVAAMTALAATPALAQERITIGAMNATISHYGYVVSVGNIVNEAVEGYSASVIETGASIDNLNRMSRGQLTMGVITTPALYQAFNGRDRFEGRPIKSRLLWIYSAAPQLVIVTRDSDVTTLDDLKGRSFSPGPRGSGTEEAALSVFATLGVEPNFFRGAMPELSAGIKDNRTLGLVNSAVRNTFQPAVTEVSAQRPLRVVGLNSDQADILREVRPELSIFNIPANPDHDTTQDVQTWGFMAGLAASPEMPEEMGYRIVKAVMENIGQQRDAFAGLYEGDLAKLTIDQANSPLHPGAVRYYEEQGYVIPDRLK